MALSATAFGADRARPVDPAQPAAPKPAAEAVALENPFRPLDDRSVFSPSSNRSSPFFYTVEVAGGSEPSFIGRRIGLGEMLAEFVRPSAMGSLPGGREVFINNRFYARKDVFRLEVTKNPNSYEIPVAEFVVEEVGEDYVDLVYRPTQSSNRVTFNLTPDITGEGPKSRVEGASLWFLGAEDAVAKPGEASEDVRRFKSAQPPRPKPVKGPKSLTAKPVGKSAAPSPAVVPAAVKPAGTNPPGTVGSQVLLPAKR